MDDVRSGNMKVSNMKEEIRKSIKKLEAGYLHKRALRQLMDGNKFLDMLRKPPYNKCMKISDLKKRIKTEREKLKERLVEIDYYMPGHQFTFFENPKETTEQEKKEIATEKIRLQKEIRWLHKCLGMCSNRNYFS